MKSIHRLHAPQNGVNTKEGYDGCYFGFYKFALINYFNKVANKGKSLPGSAFRFLHLRPRLMHVFHRRVLMTTIAAEIL